MFTSTDTLTRHRAAMREMYHNESTESLQAMKMRMECSDNTLHTNPETDQKWRLITAELNSRESS